MVSNTKEEAQVRGGERRWVRDENNANARGREEEDHEDDVQ